MSVKPHTQVWDLFYHYMFTSTLLHKCQSCEADLDLDLDCEAKFLAGDSCWSLPGGDFELRFLFLLSEWERERLLDFLLESLSLERLLDSFLDLTLDLLLERDLRLSEPERDFLLLLGLCDLRLRERDFSGDLEWLDFLFDLERDFRPDLE